MPKNSAKEKLNTNNTLISVSEAAKILKISPSSLRRLEQENRVTSTRKDNGYRSFDRVNVLKLKELLDGEKFIEEKM